MSFCWSVYPCQSTRQYWIIVIVQQEIICFLYFDVVGSTSNLGRIAVRHGWCYILKLVSFHWMAWHWVLMFCHDTENCCNLSVHGQICPKCYVLIRTHLQANIDSCSIVYWYIVVKAPPTCNRKLPSTKQSTVVFVKIKAKMP